MIIADRVQMRTDTAPGTSALSNMVTTPGHISFSSAGIGTVLYCIVGETSGNWEVGYGASSGATGLTRDTVLSRYDALAGASGLSKVSFSEPVTVSVVVPAVCLPGHLPTSNLPPSIYPGTYGGLAMGAGSSVLADNALALGTAAHADGQGGVALLGHTTYRNSVAVGETSSDLPIGASVAVRANSATCSAFEWVGEGWFGPSQTGELYDISNRRPAPDLGTWAFDMTVAGHRSDGAHFAREYRGVLVRYSGTTTLHGLTATDIHIAAGVTLGVSVAVSGSELVVSVVGEASYNWSVGARARLLMIRL